MSKIIPIEVSARHVHLSQKDLEKLFGRNYQLKKMKSLTLPGEFAAGEMVEIKGFKGKLNLRVIGPVRENTQVELSITDAITLGIKPIIKISGDIKNTPGALLTGPKGKVKINAGVIIAQRHIHCSQKEAEELNLKNKQIVSIKVGGKRGLIFNQVKVKVKSNYKLVMHIDTDEGNSAGINQKTKGFLII